MVTAGGVREVGWVVCYSLLIGERFSGASTPFHNRRRRANGRRHGFGDDVVIHFHESTFAGCISRGAPGEFGIDKFLGGLSGQDEIDQSFSLLGVRSVCD